MRPMRAKRRPAVNRSPAARARSVAWALSSALAILLTQPLPASAAEISFSCNAYGCVFAGAETLLVAVEIDATDDLRGVSLFLEFDPGIVRLVSVEPGSLVAGSACSWFFYRLDRTVGGNRIDADLAGLGCSVDGPGPVVLLRFTGKNPGQSPLLCTDLILRDSLNRTIPGDCIDGLLIYDVGVPIRPATWSLLKARYQD